MRMVLHIFRKDAIRLWKEILLCQALLAWLTAMDSWRGYAVPGSTEGWLNLLLPLAWCYLIAACSMLDAAPGERQFWLALPVRRATVFGAKALFAAAFIHAPYLVSCALVLNARGFHPWAEIPNLLEKQVIVFLVATLPALALASIANNAMQFLLMAIALAGAAAVLGGDGSLPFLNAPQGTPDPARAGLVLAIGSALAAAMLWIQYRDRRTRQSRGIGIAGVAVAAALYLWLPLHATVSLQSAFMPIPDQGPLSVQLGDGVKADGGATGPGSMGVRVRVPIRIAGLAAGIQPGFDNLDFQIQSAGGEVVRAYPSGPTVWRNPALAAVIGGQQIGHGTYFLDLSMERGLYASLSNGPVTVRGHFRLLRRSGQKTQSLTGGEAVPELGRCSTLVTGANIYREQGLRVLCESTAALPRTLVEFTDTRTGGHWAERLGQSGGFVFYPTLAWLSPLNRAEAWFWLTSSESRIPGSQWRAPVSALRHYRLQAESYRTLGLAVVDYELSGVDLNRYVVTK